MTDSAAEPLGIVDDRRWRELLGQLDPATLTDVLLARLSEVTGYESPRVPRAEIRRTTERSMEILLDGLRSGGIDDTATMPSELGVTRARAGVELSALITAIRLDFAVLWDALMEVADEADAQLIVRRTRSVMRTVDLWVERVQRAYLAEEQRMREDSASLRREAIDALLHLPRATQDTVDTAGRELGFAPADPLIVAAAVRGDIAALRVGLAELERGGVRGHAAHVDGAFVVFTAGRGGAGLDESEATALFSTLRVGLTRAEDGLIGLRSAAVQARELALLLAPDESEAMTWERGWARRAARLLDGSGAPVTADVDAALAQCSDAKRTRLLETVRSYLATGSIGVTAQALFCHRNTVSKQLQQFRDLTGVDPTVPEAAARLVVGWA